VNATPHIVQNTNGRSSAIDGRTTRHRGDAVSQRFRKRIEQAFGWIKTVAGTAELLGDGTIEIEFAYHNGDEAVLKAKRLTSSTAC